jgi:hypothetical protein
MRNVEWRASQLFVSDASGEHTVTHDMVDTRFRACRWEQEERPEHLDAEIDAWRQALPQAEAGSTMQSSRADRLGRLLAARYTHTGDVRDLDEAIAALNLGCASTDDLATRCDRLRYLGDALLERYAQSTQPDNLDYAVSALSEAHRHGGKPAVGVSDSERLACARSLASALTARFAMRGDPADLDSAINVLQHLRTAVAGRGRSVTR